MSMSIAAETPNLLALTTGNALKYEASDGFY
jgi:hypothetical protein